MYRKTDDDQLNEIRTIEKFKDNYVLKLAITDHIDELKHKDTYMKMKDIPKGRNDHRDNFEKELADLYILLDVYFNKNVMNASLVDIRADKIISKQKGNNDE